MFLYVLGYFLFILGGGYSVESLWSRVISTSHKSQIFRLEFVQIQNLKTTVDSERLECF